MKRLKFYFKYAWRSVLRGSQRSFFAVLCIAVGVAALVGIQVLEQSINDTLVGDAKERAGGDLVVTARNRNSDGTDPGFTAADLTSFDELKTQGKIQDWAGFTQADVRLRGYFGFPPTFYIVDPNKFPLYGKIKMLQPQGVEFNQLLKGTPNGVIVSKTLWQKQHLQLGQDLQITGGSAGQSVTLKVLGESDVVVPGFQISNGTIFGFGFVSLNTAQQFLKPTELQPRTVFIKAAPNVTLDEARNTVESVIASRNRVQTATEIQEQIQSGIDQTKPLLTYVGLLSLLIGGVGVVNTMLVVIGRRTTEIATVKALGLKKWQTITVFTLEAACIGVIGSVVGIVLGEILSLVFNQVAEGLFLRPLVWKLYPLPILTGLVVGLVTTLVFGFLPSYAAGKVRPGVVLRLQSGALPGVGGVASILIVLVMTTVLGLTAGLITGNVLQGIAISFGTLVGSLILIGILWLIVWVVGLLPAPLGPSFKMAMRSFSRHRGRTATTVAVIVIGIFSVSFIVILAEGIKETFRDLFDTNLGYNVAGLNIQAIPSSDLPKLQTNLAQLPGYQSGFFGNNTGAIISAVNGENWSSYQSKLPVNAKSGAASSDILVSGRGFVNNKGTGGNTKLISGRNLGPADANQDVMIVSQKQASDYGVKIGDKLTLQPDLSRRGFAASSSQAKAVTFEIVGILDSSNATVSFESPWIAPYQAVSTLGSQMTFIYLLINRPQVQTALTQLQTTQPQLFLLDLSDLIDTFSRLLDQFLAFPTMLSFLSLFSGAVLIANNVALAMLERRTEIGVLKAIGAKQRRIMTIILWESGLTGLLGGLIGVALALFILFGIAQVGNASGKGGPSIGWSPLVAGLLVLMSVALAVVSTVASAWGAVREKPLVVLRYE